MKKFLQHIKWHRIVWLLAGAVVMMLSLQAVDYRDVQKITHADAQIDHSTGLFFIDSITVADVLSEQRIYPGASLTMSVPCKKLEKVLEGNPYCEDAEVYIDALGTLHIDIQQRVPVIRIINTNGVSYYVDQYGTKLPLHDKFTARVVAANGFIVTSDNNADSIGGKLLNDLVTVTLALNSDTLLSRLMDQIWIDEKLEMHLVPKFVKQEVLLGHSDDLETKLNKLGAFYRYTAKNTLSNYKTIDLRYDNEIYATRRDFVHVAKAINDTLSKHQNPQ